MPRPPLLAPEERPRPTREDKGKQPMPPQAAMEALRLGREPVGHSLEAALAALRVPPPRAQPQVLQP